MNLVKTWSPSVSFTTFDFAVATPAFLDLTFVGLESLPDLGEERFAGELLRSAEYADRVTP